MKLDTALSRLLLLGGCLLLSAAGGCQFDQGGTGFTAVSDSPDGPPPRPASPNATNPSAPGAANPSAPVNPSSPDAGPYAPPSPDGGSTGSSVADAGGGAPGPTPPPPSPPAQTPPPATSPPPSSPPPAPTPPSAGPGASGCPDDPDLVLCLGFEGRAVDESPAHLPIEGTPLGFEPGPSGQAARLGPGGHLTIAETPVLDSQTITVQASVRPAALGRTMTVVENPGQYSLVIMASGSVMCGAGSNGQLLQPRAVLAGIWTQLRCVFEDGRVTLWVDGQLMAATFVGPLNTSRTAGLHIGWDDDPPRPYEGLIDDLRIWRTGRPPR